MRSRAARLTLGALAWMAIGVPGLFLIHSERQTADRRAAVRAFDLHAREAADMLADLRAGQEAYVAAGQGAAFWMPKVAEMASTATTMIAGLQRAATSTGAGSALDEAAAAMTEFAVVDKRAREYIDGQRLMAADIIFSEGVEEAVAAARQVERARLAEHRAFDAEEAAVRRQEALALAGGAGVAALAVLLLVPAPRVREAESNSVAEAARLAPDGGLSLRAAVPAAAPPGDAPLSYTPARAAAPVLKAAAQLCTDFGRVSDLAGLKTLIGRAADVMDASGVVLWIGSAAGDDMRPVLAHGYSEQAVARMPAVPRSADNAAAAAYRTGTLQIVAGRAGRSSGAVIAPVVTSRGCIGALSAEIRGGGETSDSVQALATVFAAQLAGVLVTAPESGEGKVAAL